MIGVVHLVWAPLGVGPVRQFLRSYQGHRAGAKHELAVILNGASESAGALTRAQLLGELQDIEHQLVTLDQPTLDLAAYGHAARELEYERLCFLNSYSVMLADNWLEMLNRALEVPKTGLAGATGSWESQAEWGRGKSRYWLYQLAQLRAMRVAYPRFPNPHIRTTGFMLDRELLLELGLDGAADKQAAYLLESGRNSITRQVQERSLKALVVGRNGRTYEAEDWASSATYRAGGQENLLIADNRTLDWEHASARLRSRLSRDAWGFSPP